MYVCMYVCMYVPLCVGRSMGKAGIHLKYRMEGNFGGCKLWRIGKENFIGGINFGELITKV